MVANLSEQIYLSRDQIRLQMIEYMKGYLELESVDLTKSAFLSYMVDTISTLTSNLLFYQTSVYKEFFLTKAQLPESILNLAAFLGYRPSAASYATANVLVTIPFGFDLAAGEELSFMIPYDVNMPETSFNFYADNVIFTPDYKTTITVIGNTAVEVEVEKDGNIYNLPVNIDTTANNEFSFLLPIRQYKTTVQEFQLDSDLVDYQFTDIAVPFEGKLSDITVGVKPPESTLVTNYTPFDSLYLMTSDDTGYVYRRTGDGIKIFFGNNLIGKQPPAGSTIIVTIQETEGSDGNVIAGSIVKGSRIYAVQDGRTQVVNYSAINVAPASGGSDEEDLEDTRQNAIDSITSLGRLVSEPDYSHANVVIPNSPLAGNSIPILKRSDLKVNEIQLYTTLLFGNDIVPTRNTKYEISEEITDVPRNTVVTVDETDYYTLFDMTIENINSVAYYHYIMHEINVVPNRLSVATGESFSMSANGLQVQKIGNNAKFTLSYFSNETPAVYGDSTCIMTISDLDSSTYTMTNNPGTRGGTFTLTTPHSNISDGTLTYKFSIYKKSGVENVLVTEYSTALVFKQDLSEFMMSNVVLDGTANIVYDIPVVQKTFYDGIVQKDFELQVLQTMLQSMDFINYRMLTDFINVKFCNTSGPLTNMALNEVTKSAVIDIGLSEVPIADEGDRYIVTGFEEGDWAGHKDDIALCIDATSQSWTFIEPKTDDTLIVTDKDARYIYSPKGWVVPDYELPFIIEIEVFRDPLVQTVTENELVDAVKTAIYDGFYASFGPNTAFYRSEIIKVVQSVEGVNHCRLIRPATNIFFKFELDEFTQDELLEYTPEYIHFNRDDIICKIQTIE